MRNFFRLPVILLLCTLFCSYSGRAITPVISTQPHDTSACIGTNAYFSITVSNDTLLSSLIFAYKWQVSSDGGITWANASSAKYVDSNLPTLTIVNDSTLNNYKYRCIVADTIAHIYDTSLVGTLTVVLHPVAGTITGTDSLCIGSYTTFTHTGSTGLWSSSAPAIATVVSGSGLVTGVSRGIDSIKYSVTNICGVATVKKVIRIDSLPNVSSITGSSPICVGASQTFTNLSTGAWSHTNSIADTLAIPTGTITARAQGFDTIKFTVTDLHGCTNTSRYVVRVDTVVTPLAITGPTNTCIGDSIRLNNMNVLGTWIWSAANSNATVNHGGWVRGVTYGTNGMDTISYAFTNACNTVTDSFVVHIDSAYNPGTISGPSTLCAGSWLSLTESIGGGFWENDNHAIAVVNSLGYVTGYSQGVTVISYLVSSGSCGYSIATHSVTVQQDAQMISGIDSVGVGHTTTLSDVTISGTWSSSNTAVATINSLTGVVTGIATGTSIISYTVTNICGTTSATLVMHVGTPPPAGVIYGPNLVCIGNQITLNDTLVRGGVWSVDNTTYASINSTTGVLSGLSTGGDLMIDSQRTVHALYIVHNAFGYDTLKYTVIVRHTPILLVYGPHIVALGGNYYITGFPFGGTWSTSNTHVGMIISVLDSNGVHQRSMASFVMINRGTDTIHYHYVDPKGCGTTDSFWVVSLPVINNVGNVNADNSSLNVFPNPTTGEFTINLPNDNNQQVMVTISNMVGEKVKEIMMNTNEPFKVKLDEPTGMYIITAVANDGSRYVTKLTLNK